ncbi:fumarylacetoacetate hydrolase family protein [Cupriavidus sp. CV2]|uniref:fumarylacetoacetate hydrolase family protein n=1 Tax=Cupriavidus ulmosensis TaxID=3065913 RepID=UPI00296B1502|nr:fumarylacetoacetate hydrolase family protein [Cupriavidus sp. CV2]MDW3685996.1 fumarylacetoacetate hydrolase family protein [Cupriavidus sp. CV2]
MRFATYRHDQHVSFGAVAGEYIHDLATSEVATLRAALEVWGMAGLQQRAAEAQASFPLSTIEFLPPIPDPGKILCVGVNYRRHAAEAGLGVPDFPALFVRFPGAQVGHGQAVWRPRRSDKFDYEAELAVVIGRRARHVDERQAMGSIAGYCCFAENSVRDFQRHSTQATAGKNFQASGAFGPWITAAAGVNDPFCLEVIGRLNGEEVQRDRVANMIFPIPRLIAYISAFTELLPGDVIVTGTPAGVGFARKPPVYLTPGDTFEVEIEGVGLLRNPVVDEPSIPID